MSDQERLEKIMEVLLQYTTRDFSKKLPISTEGDELDTISMGVNILGEEVEDFVNKNDQLIHFLQEKNKELSHFAYLTSHDLQEPLRTVLAFNQLFFREYAHLLDDKGKQYLKFINNASIKMKNMVDGLLVYSKIGENKTFETINVSHMVTLLTQKAQSKHPKGNIEFQIGQLENVKGVESDLTLLFSDLITNSTKFISSKKTPHIKLTSSKEGPMVKFTITDNGIGIPKKYQEKCFVLFQKLNDHDKYPGIGIGLALCKKIINLYGGDIIVNPDYTDGTEITFTLPAA